MKDWLQNENCCLSEPQARMKEIILEKFEDGAYTSCNTRERWKTARCLIPAWDASRWKDLWAPGK